MTIRTTERPRSVRFYPDQNLLVDSAADVLGVSCSDLIREAAVERATAVLLENERAERDRAS